jgi:hypothetical protein
MLTKKRMLIPLTPPAGSLPRRARKRSFADSLLNVVGSLVGRLYSFAFGWADHRLARRHQQEFEEEIRSQLGFLFTEHNAQVIPNEGVPFPPGFDGAYVTVAVGAVRLRFVRGRGDFGISVGSEFSPGRWEDFGLVAEGISEWDVSLRRRDIAYSLSSVEPVLRRRLTDLQQSLSEANVETTMNRAIELHNKSVDEYAARLTAAGVTPKFY